MKAPAISRKTQLDGGVALAPHREAAPLPLLIWLQLSRRTLRIAAFFILALACAAVLLLFPPAQYSFYPQCPIHHYLGILCPGCGTTRALAALLHGHLSEALRLNPLTTLTIPFTILWKLFSRKPLRLIQPSPAALWVAFAVIAVFTVARNL